MRIIITVRSAEDGSEKCRMQNACGCDRGSAFFVLWEENLCFVAETTELFLEMYYNGGIISRQGRFAVRAYGRIKKESGL